MNNVTDIRRWVVTLAAAPYGPLREHDWITFEERDLVLSGQYLGLPDLAPLPPSAPALVTARNQVSLSYASISPSPPFRLLRLASPDFEPTLVPSCLAYRSPHLQLVDV